MISLTCTNCRAVLSIDDAFAGGVCRCQHCGTIQTVPTHLKRRAATPNLPGTNGADGGGTSGGTGGTGGTGTSQRTSPAPKALYKRRARGDGAGTGLDELAEVVASSGAMGSGLTATRLRQAPGTAPADAPRPTTALLLATAGIVIVLLLGVVLWLTVGRSTPPSPGPGAVAGAGPAAPGSEPPGAGLGSATPAGYTEPAFCGTTLNDTPVIYVLDRGNGTREVFDTLKEATFRSIESLGADRKFQVVFWNNGSDYAYPSGLPSYATRENLNACRRALEDITAFNQSDAVPALQKAVGNRPGAIVLATGKGPELDPVLVEQVTSIRKSHAVKIHTFALGDVESPVLRDIARLSGGEYKTVSAGKLREYAE